MRYYRPPNCSKCGRFVGRDGFDDYCAETGELGYPLCTRCLDARPPTRYDMEMEINTINNEVTKENVNLSYLRLVVLENRIARIKNLWGRAHDE